MINYTGFYFKILKLFFIITVLLYPLNLFSQPLTNFNVINNLVDSSVYQIVNENNLKNKKLVIEKYLPGQYSIFNNQISSSFLKYSGTDSTGVVKLSYAVEEVKVVYQNLYRDGFLGEYYIERNISLKGNALINLNNSQAKPFALSVIDTVKYDELKNFENQAFPFTQGEIPAEPFWSSLLEPAVAIGSAAVAVYLFFSVRSK